MWRTMSLPRLQVLSRSPLPTQTPRPFGREELCCCKARTLRSQWMAIFEAFYQRVTMMSGDLKSGLSWELAPPPEAADGSQSTGKRGLVVCPPRKAPLLLYVHQLDTACYDLTLFQVHTEGSNKKFPPSRGPGRAAGAGAQRMLLLLHVNI